MLHTDTHREGERVREQSFGLAANQCHRTAFVQRVDSEKTFQTGTGKDVEDARREKKKHRKTGKENDRAGGGKGQKREKNITTKGRCKEEYRQIMRKEKNEEWEEGL